MGYNFSLFSGSLALEAFFLLLSFKENLVFLRGGLLGLDGGESDLETDGILSDLNLDSLTKIKTLYKKL